MNFAIYDLASRNATGGYFRRTIPGNNGFYSTDGGYNRVLGNGTLVVKNFIGLPGAPAAGIPQTPSNP